MKARNLYNEGFYHLYNRGVDKRNVFGDDCDRRKFLLYLLKCNIHSMVRIHAYCLMGNHFHLLVEQLEDDGIWKFMQKLGTGYTMHFNRKYGRKGRLFESSYRSVEVSSHGQYLHISRYIHMNPLNIFAPDWKEHGVKDPDIAELFLQDYKWSSYKVYMGMHSPVVDPSKILEDFANREDYRLFVQQWMNISGGG